MTREDLIDIRFATYKMCRTAIHLALGATLIGMVGSFALISTAEAATLKSNSTINSDKVTLGDLFDGTLHPETVLGNAPELGKDMVLNAVTLKRIATNYNIAWEGGGALNDELTIHRDSRTVDTTTITDAIKSALTAKGVKGNFNLTMTNDSPTILLPGNVDANVEVAALNYEQGRDVFTVKLASPSVANPVKTLEISGLINRLVSVPTLTGSARKGDIISASDIAFVDMPERMVTKDTIVDADDIIGKTPSRVISTDRPIRFNDVTNPQLVTRGDDVTIVYKVGGMTLSAKGKSMQNGTEGDLIRVTNIASTKSMSALVTGDRMVTVE